MNIKINDFLKEYKGNSIKFDSICLTGRVVLIKGENGSGKSTLLKAISGFIKYKGSIINDQSISYMNEQTFLPNGCSLLEFLLMFSEKDHMMSFIKSFNLSSKLNNDLSSLSKGMRMKVNVIICLMDDKDLFILDEPFSGLDKESVEVLINYINNSDKDFLISTHLDYPCKINDMNEVII